MIGDPEKIREIIDKCKNKTPVSEAEYRQYFNYLKKRGNIDISWFEDDTE